MIIRTIDLHFQGLPQVIAAFLLESDGEYALVETGPATTRNSLLKGLREWGVAPQQISKVLLTHIHLDHAGDAGWWASQGAQVFVHERGARHLIDPSKLIAGAQMVYGDLMEELWGEILPAPEEQVTILKDGETVQVGAETLTAWDTPGHARHHLAFIWGKEAFVGDVAGVRLPGYQYICATTAPSQFEPEPYIESIRRLRNEGLEAMYLTHFGKCVEVDEHLERYEQVIGEVSQLVRQLLEAKTPMHEIRASFSGLCRKRFEETGDPPEAWPAYESANPLNMCCDGVVQYWERQFRNAG